MDDCNGMYKILADLKAGHGGTPVTSIAVTTSQILELGSDIDMLYGAQGADIAELEEFDFAAAERRLISSLQGGTLPELSELQCLTATGRTPSEPELQSINPLFKFNALGATTGRTPNRQTKSQVPKRDDLGTLLSTEQLQEVAQYLYKLLDDIDTAGDIAKGDDKLYRSIVERAQKKKSKVVANCDGFSVTFKPLDL